MQEHVPRLPFAVDPLIAEAKRRRRRRWLLVAVAIVSAAVAAVGVDRGLRTPSHRLTTPPNHRLGIARIPGMTMIALDHSSDVCFPFSMGRFFGPGRELPSTGSCGLNYNSPGVSVGIHLDQVWVFAPAVAKIGKRRLRRDAFGPYEPAALAGALPLPTGLIRRHPGPVEVQVRVRTGEAWNPRRGPTGWAGSRDAAERLLRSGLIGGSVDPRHNIRFIPLPDWTINGGLAGRLNAPGNRGLSRFQFAWAAGVHVVLVDVLGANLTVAEAQRVAALAGPSA
jgi:hypothetical protein